MKKNNPIWVKRVKPHKRNSKGAYGFKIPKDKLDDGDILPTHLYSYCVIDLGEIGQPGTNDTLCNKELEAQLDDEIDNF